MEFVFSMLLILQGARSVLLFQGSVTGKKTASKFSWCLKGYTNRKFSLILLRSTAFAILLILRDGKH